MVAIEVRNLSKLYRLGASIRHDTLRDAIAQGARALLGLRREAPLPPKEDEESIWALRDVSFDVQEGDVLGIIGRNGAGKSTLLKILSRITEPTEGEVIMRGRVASLLEVGTGFHPELTGRENIFLNGAILGMKKEEIKKKFDEIAAFSEVERFLDTPVKRYSSGMYVRLAFAVAAHLEPEILVVDEVLAVGDASFQRKCLGKMGDVARSGRTVLFISHNMGMIQGLCTRGIWIEKGALAAAGETGEVISSYLGYLHGEQQQDGVALYDSEDITIEKITLVGPAGGQASTFAPGEDICVEVHYNAKRRLERPYFWVLLEGKYGPLLEANMLLDGMRPEGIEGRGKIGCTFRGLNLMPQTYGVSVGARCHDGLGMLVPGIRGIVSFSVIGDAGDYGMQGELADKFIGKSAAPVIMPYEWRTPDGRVMSPGWSKGGNRNGA